MNFDRRGLKKVRVNDMDIFFISLESGRSFKKVELINWGYNSYMQNIFLSLNPLYWSKSESFDD